jgi:PAS domain S-box-containing protein
MKNFFPGLSLKNKMYVISIAVFLLSILFAGGFAGISFKYFIKQIALNNASKINQGFAYKVESEIQKEIIAINTLALILSQYNQSGNTEENLNPSETLKTLMNLNPAIIGLLLETPGETKNDSLGKTVDNVQTYRIFLERKNDESIDYNPFDPDFMEMVSQNLPSDEENFSISEPFRRSRGNTSEFLISYSASIKYQNRDKFGLLTILFSLNNFSRILNEAVYGNNSRSILLTENNTIISVSNKPWMTGKNIIKFQGEEHEIFTKIIGTDQNVVDYRNALVSNQNIILPGSDLKWRLITIIPLKNITGNIYNQLIYIILISSAFMIAGLILILILIRKTIYPLILTSKSIRQLAEGNLISLPKGNFPNEFNEIFEGINQISDHLNHISQVSFEIAQGNIDKKIDVKNDNDILSISVNKIAENLKQTIIDGKIKEESTDRQLWMRRGRFEVAEAERISSDKPEDLAFNLIRSIVNYTNAVMGGIYNYDEDTEKAEFIAAYAYGNRKLIKKEFKKGEGLVGTCIIEKKKIELNKVPDDYLKISTGLGSGSPGYLIVIPVFFQEKINSVIEIAFYKKPDDHIIEFIEQLSDSIGGWMDASSKKNKTIELLRISTEQTQLLAQKEEELNIKINELQKVQHEMAHKNAEYESMLRAVNHSVMTVRYTTEGVLLDANDVYLKTMGFQINELIGINVFDLVKDQETDLRRIIERVINGDSVHKQVKRYTKNGNPKWLSATYTPYIDADNNVTGVLFFAVENPLQ